MKISAFTIVRDAERFDFQIEESIRSVLPIVDEFIVNVGKSDDGTLQMVQNIGSDKIRIIESEWDTLKYDRGGQIFAHQTNMMLKECKGDWCIYLQADEVLHENAHLEIKTACQKYLNDASIDGFLLRYVHIYGDYKHYIPARHIAYPKEVRIVRNIKDIHSWKDAQSFRKIKDFDYKDYYITKGTQKLNCILLDDAFIFHYGWSRDPYKMVKKIIVQKTLHEGEDAVKNMQQPYHDYGNISCFPKFKGTHPEVMAARIERMNWQEVLSYSGAKPGLKKIFSLKYRLINFVESFLPHGNRLWGFKNYKQVGIFKAEK